MGDLAGTIRNVKLNTISFDAMADANVTSNDSNEKEGIATSSSRNMIKVTKKVPTREGIDLAANPAEHEVILALSLETVPFPMSIEYADGSIYRTEGLINVEGHESESNKTTIIMIPTREWNAFVN